MPTDVRDSIASGYSKKGMSKKQAMGIAYATMTKMGWRRGMSDQEAKKVMKRHMKVSARRAALGISGLLLLCLPVQAVAPPTQHSAMSNKPSIFGNAPLYGLSPYTQERIAVNMDATNPPHYGTCRTFIPWSVSGTDTVGYQAVSCRVVCTSGTVYIRPFGPHFKTSKASQRDICISALGDSVSPSWEAPTAVDSLWMWKITGTAQVVVACF